MRKTLSSKVFDTLKQAAEFYGLALPQMKWLKANATGFKNGRVHDAELGPWIKSNRDSIPSVEELIGNKERIEGLRARKLELEIGKLEGDFISRIELRD
jgi:hypothetical protein